MSSIIALDLSLNATGYVVMEDDDDLIGLDQGEHGEIKTPSRKKGQSDMLWNAARYRKFSESLLSLLVKYRPETVVMEVSTQVFSSKLRTGRYGAGAQYRAGQGLGRAMGWVDGVIAQASAYGCAPLDVIPMSANKAKLGTTGNRAAKKDTVRSFLEGSYAWILDGWEPGAVDALAVLMTHLRDIKGDQAIIMGRMVAI
jgi:Holliday junction resolvasome RuvABC endonuclease subunit